MNEQLKTKTKEALGSVLPISAIVLALSILLVPLSVDTIAMFLFGTAMLVLGMGLFSLGADMAMMPIGEGVGRALGKRSKLGMAAAILFVLGFLITISEPDLSVLANQVPAIPNMALILTVAAGVGAFLVLAFWRMKRGMKLNTLLLLCYAVVFALSIFTPNSFLSVAFDSGGVTTGPMTVPLLLSLGLGLAAAHGGGKPQRDSFGFVALCSIGPILAVMVLGIFFNPSEASYTPVVVPEMATMRDVARAFLTQIPAYFKEVLVALVPICAFFLVFQRISKRYTKRQALKISVGLVYTLLGLVLFLTGVNVGFIPVGNLIGRELASSGAPWLLIPVGMLIGYFIVVAEPAIHVLNEQVEQVTGGTITRKAMNLCLSIGVAISVGLAMMRVLTGISIYWLMIPGYAIALVLSRFVPDMFVGIAFDSGGVASGPMTSTFLLPLVMGACEAVGGNVMTDAFGIVAMVAMTPLIAIQLMGLVYKIRTDRAQRQADEAELDLLDLLNEEERSALPEQSVTEEVQHGAQ